MSAHFPIIPSRASISRTIVPFATPPIDGLQDNSPMFSLLKVISITLAPILAAAHAASIPALPAPMTIVSYIF